MGDEASKSCDIVKFGCIHIHVLWIYINRVQNLDLSEILPLNLDEIVPPHIDIDSIEWYVRENYDDTFKAAGGIILNRDETIGAVNVFRPNDGKIGITKEEKE